VRQRLQRLRPRPRPRRLDVLRREEVFFPNTRFAFALIFAAVDRDSFPRFTICVARAFAFAAWRLSCIGYARRPGRPKELLRSRLRLLAFKRATVTAPRESAIPHHVPPRWMDMSTAAYAYNCAVAAIIIGTLAGCLVAANRLRKR
jgi:hypothetical protein